VICPSDVAVTRNSQFTIATATKKETKIFKTAAVLGRKGEVKLDVIP